MSLKLLGSLQTPYFPDPQDGQGHTHKNEVHPKHNRMAALHIGYGLPVLYDHK